MTETKPGTENSWGSARPWLTADIVVIRGDRVLLIQRADEPHRVAGPCRASTTRPTATRASVWSRSRTCWRWRPG